MHITDSVWIAISLKQAEISENFANMLMLHYRRMVILEPTEESELEGLYMGIDTVHYKLARDMREFMYNIQNDAWDVQVISNDKLKQKFK